MYPYPDHMNSSNHAVFQSMYHSKGSDVLGSKIPTPCCVPTEYDNLDMLYIVPLEEPISKDENEPVVMKTYEKMRVTACGCRWNVNKQLTTNVPYLFFVK